MDDPDTTPWPPTLWFTNYQREVPPSFRPKFNRPAIPLSGEGLLLIPPDGITASAPAEDSGAQHEARMLITWAREAVRTGERYYRLACLVNWTDWAIDKGEDWSPTERELRDELAAWWVSGQQAVEAYFHFQVWRKKAHGDHVDDLVRRLRNSLVHLDEALLDDYSARTTVNDAGKRLAWDIEKLPEGQLPLAFHPGCLDALFGLIPLRAIYRSANPHSSWPDEDRDWSDYEFDPPHEGDND